MATVAGRKKSIVSSTGIHIDTPIANNTLLNKAASTSLYQQCSALRSRLMRVKGFSPYFTLITSSDSRQSTDPVTQLWDLFSFGIPLCYLFDQLPEDAGFSKINYSEFNQEQYDANPVRAKKHAIALFAMQIRNHKDRIPGSELFTISELGGEREQTDGLVKVVHTVTAVVDLLPPDAFEASPPSPHSLSAHDSYDSLADSLPPPPANAQEAARNNIIREMVETERKYVQDLEIMQKYSNALSQGNIIDQDTIHLLFPNLNKLLNFQRKFLIRFESTAELPWQDQRWGQLFLESEDEFIVYEPYCANYTAASELMMANEESLVPLNHLINVKGELPAFLIKPVQRVCKYPLLLDSLIKACPADTYPHLEELKKGSDAAKRIADKINEAQRRAENEQTVKSLQQRITNWKGHHLENFGELLLDDIIHIAKSDIDREYHVFLFEKIILCCKEEFDPLGGMKKVGKSNSILKKQPVPPPLSLPGNGGAGQRRNTPLILKGRIFLGNVTDVSPVPIRQSTASGIPACYPLNVYWRGDDDLESFTLRFKREEQMRQWEAQFKRLINEARSRRQDQNGGLSRILAMSNSTNPAPNRASSQQSSYGAMSVYSNHSSMPVHVRPSRAANPHQAESSAGTPFAPGPQGYPQGFEFENDEEEYEDYPPASTYAPSGHGTPAGARSRNHSAYVVPSDRDSAAYERPRAHTESQWRVSQGGTSNLSSSVISPNGTMMRATTPRMNSNMSANSYQSDASFGTGVPPPKSSTRPPLRSQFSSTRLRSTQDMGDYRNGRSATPTLSSNANGLPAPPPMNRSRSASQPSAYVPPKQVPPPLPTNNLNQSHWSHTNAAVGTSKRGSGSSESTGDSSDYSPNSSSPITPFGSSESSLAGVGIRNSRSQNFDNVMHGHDHVMPPVKVKVHFHEDIFVIQVPRTTEYDDLVEKVGRKIRLCGPRRDDGPLRVKYRDEDGDMVSLGSTEDVQMAFEQWKPGGQVTLYVT